MVDLIERRRAASIAYRRAITQKPRNWAKVWTAAREVCAANAAIASLNTPDQGATSMTIADGRCPNCGEDEMDGARCHYCGYHEYSCDMPDCTWCNEGSEQHG